MPYNHSPKQAAAATTSHQSLSNSPLAHSPRSPLVPTLPLHSPTTEQRATMTMVKTTMQKSKRIAHYVSLAGFSPNGMCSQPPSFPDAIQSILSVRERTPNLSLISSLCTYVVIHL